MPGGCDDGAACPGRSRRVSALLSAVAVLVAGCTTAGGGSSLRAGRAGPAQHLVAARPHGRVVGHRIAGTPAPVSVTHDSEPKIAAASSLACAPPRGAPAINRADAASGLRVAVPACLCCRRCACAWACCGCGPRRWPRLCRVHTWPGRAVHAGSGQLVGIVRRSGRCVGLAADHMPAQSGQPGPLRVRTRFAPRAAQRLARADPHRQRALMPNSGR